MSRYAKRFARWLLGTPPVYRALRVRAHLRDPVSILCYHTLGQDAEAFDAWTVLRMADFRAQVDLLRAQYEIVSLDKALERPRPVSGRPRAVLTFDDGEAGLYRHLLPFLDEVQIPVTIYVATGQIETGTPYWFDRVMNALQVPGPVEIRLPQAGLEPVCIGPERGKARWARISQLLEALKAADPAERDALAMQIIGQVPAPTGDVTPLAPMSVAELTELSRSPWVTIGAHSHCHSLLDQIPANEVAESAGRSRALLEEWTGQEIRHFAYPNGNHDATVRSVIAKLGFRSATALGTRLWTCRQEAHGEGLFALPRLPVGRYDDLERFRLRLLEI